MSKRRVVRGRTGVAWVGHLVVLGILTSSSLLAQVTGGTISGLVRDESGAAVSEATITAKHLATGATRLTNSGGDGTYRLPALPVGGYEVRVEKTGFRTEVLGGLNLTVGQEAVLNAILRVGAVTEVVSVTAEAPLVETTSGSLSGVMDERGVSELPLNGRNFTQLVLLQAGVDQHTNARPGGTFNGVIFSSSGAPIRSNLFLLDGAIMNDTTGAGFANVANRALGVEGVREFRLITNSFSAEYGMSMGGVMQVATKSGTNRLHGTAFEYLRNNNLDARKFFDVGHPPEFKRNQFGFSLGGPILREKTFFFGTYEGVREILGTTTKSPTINALARQDGGLVPRVAESIKPYLAFYPLPNAGDLGGGVGNVIFDHPVLSPEDFFQVRVDHNLAQNDSLFVRYTFDKASQNAVDGPFPSFIQDSRSRSQYATLEERHIFSPIVLNTARFSFNRTNSYRGNTTTVPKELWLITGAPMMGVFNIPGVGRLGGGPPTPGASKQNIFQLNDDVFISKGAHALKFGTLYN